MAKNEITATIKTDKGDIKLNLFKDNAPQTVENFVKLACENFYDGLTWHRVVDGFVIQGGDPSGDGSGGPGYSFEDEINSQSLGLSSDAISALEAEGYMYNSELESKKMEKGSLAMANSGPNTNGSQFFIVTDEAQPHLDGRHTVFGEVLEGMDVVAQVQQGDVINEIIVE
ncbi:MAG: peptidylprolyl isomerase [bacterium]